MTAGNARPGQQHRHGPRPVIASGIFVDLWRPAKFTQHHNERVVEQAALIEILDQRGQALIEPLDVIAPIGFEDFRVMIPAAVLDRDETHAHGNQSAREQQALPKIISPVSVPNRIGLAMNVERLLRFLRADQLQPLREEFIEGYCRILGQLVRVAHHPVKRLAHFEPTLRAGFINLRRQRHVADTERLAVRAAINHERRVLPTEKARSARASHLRHGDVSWQTIANPALVGNHRAE